jgi:hypothetical protein
MIIVCLRGIRVLSAVLSSGVRTPFAAVSINVSTTPFATRSVTVFLTLFATLFVFPARNELVADDADDPATAVARRASDVAAALAAGEFGPATQIAIGAATVQERVSLLKTILAGQRASGEFAAARITTQRLLRLTAPQEDERILIAPVNSGVVGGGNAEPSFVNARTSAKPVEKPVRVSPRGESNPRGSGADYGPLIDLIQSTVGPESWDSAGGNATMRVFDTGVRVDPAGQLRLLSRIEVGDRLTRLGIAARSADLNADMRQRTSLRFVSLRRLEERVAGEIEAAGVVPETMRHLAGLTRVQYLFVDEVARDILLAGPATGWRYDERQRAVSNGDGSPLLHLDDLVVLMRAFAATEHAVFGCQINPRPDRMAAVRQLSEETATGGGLTPGSTSGYVDRVRQTLGEQDVVVYGVPPGSRVARVLVEADYRMKLLGVGRLNIGAPVPGYFDYLDDKALELLQPLSALRWWMSMKYDSIVHTPDHAAFELVGSSVLVQSEDEFITAQGLRAPTGKADEPNRKFAAMFTRSFPAIARRDVAFAELQNVFDLALVAALIRKHNSLARIGWDGGVFRPGGGYEPIRYAVPKTVESAVNHRVYRGGLVVVQAAGGVTGDIESVVNDGERNKTASPTAFPEVAKPPPTPGRWWWDRPVQSETAIDDLTDRR